LPCGKVQLTFFFYAICTFYLHNHSPLVNSVVLMRLNWVHFSFGGFLCWHPGGVSGDTTATDTARYQLPPTLVTANRYQQPLQFVSENASVLTQAELAALPAHNLLESLNFLPGLTVVKNGGLGSRDQLSIQGSEARHVTLVLDGIPLNDLAEGMADPVQIPLEQVGQVEIVRGPASAAWGSALGGVVQVLSPALAPAQPTQVRAAASYGKWRTHQENLSLQGGAKGIGYLLAGGQTSTDGFRPRSAHNGHHFIGKAKRSWPGNGRLGLSWGYLDGETEDFEQFGQPLWKEHEYTTRYGQVYYQGSWHDQVETRVQVFSISRQEEVRLLQLENDQVVWGGTRDEPFWGGALQALFSSPYGQWAGGVDWRRSSADFRFVGGPDKKRFDEEGVYANWSKIQGRMGLNAGLRYNRHSLYGRQWSPSAGLIYRLEGIATVLRFHLSWGFGAPPLAAAFLPETEQTAPNPDLQAERATAYHAGFETRVCSPLWARLTWFHNDVEDAIDTALNEKGKFIQKNFARQQRQGVELEGRLALPWEVQVIGGIVFNDVKSKDKDEIINGTARQTRDLALQYRRAERGLLVWLGGHYADYEITPALKEPPLNFTDRDARFIWDLKLSQELPPIGNTTPSLYVAGYNLLDTPFWWLTPYPLPGRSFEIGIRLACGG
jgi:vitamin B12 transporter